MHLYTRTNYRRCERRLLWSDLCSKNCDEGGALYSCPLTSDPAPYNHGDGDEDDCGDDDDDMNAYDDICDDIYDEGGASYSCPLTSDPAPYNDEDRDDDEF